MSHKKGHVWSPLVELVDLAELPATTLSYAGPNNFPHSLEPFMSCGGAVWQKRTPGQSKLAGGSGEAGRSNGFDDKSAIGLFGQSPIVARLRRKVLGPPDVLNGAAPLSRIRRGNQKHLAGAHGP